MGAALSYPSGLQRFELSLGDPDYPSPLAQAPDPPKTLFGIGDPDALRLGLGVVGARRATPYGLQAAHLLAGWAAGAGYTIVSGGAIGCDQAAHRAALDAGGVTVAVMGGGADVVYPSKAATLLAEIAHRGAVVSEHPWGFRPLRWTFRTRNRIIAGLCAAVLVTEAAVGSGTFSTAEYAADAGRDVLAVPGSIFAPECVGANRLIRQGAVAITEPDDLRAALEPVLGVAQTVVPLYIALSSEGDRLLAALTTNPQRPDDLARDLGMDIVSVSRVLGMHEAEGRVVRFRDGRYGRTR